VTTGSVDETGWKRKLIAFVLAAAILVCAALLVFVTLNKQWTVAMQVISAISGAALGSILSVDSSRLTVRNQARPAMRRKFDQISRLQTLVLRVEAFEDTIRHPPDVGKRPDASRIADWLESIADGLRAEIDSTATSLEDWGDLAQDVYEHELSKYRTRGTRMPTASGEGGSVP